MIHAEGSTHEIRGAAIQAGADMAIGQRIEAVIGGDGEIAARQKIWVAPNNIKFLIVKIYFTKILILFY